MGNHDKHSTRARARGRSSYNRENYHARGAKRRPKRVLVVIVAVAVMVAALVIIKPFGCGSSLKLPGSSTLTNAESQLVSAEDEAYLPTSYVAKCKGIYLHSAISANHLTEILIHNASYNYALPLTTKLKEATNTEVMKAHGTGRVASEMPTGNHWLKGEFIRCFRSVSAGPRMSAIDCGAAAGTTVYAPVSGKVVLVKKYNLYDNKSYPDYQIHIQPTGRSDLDVVLIHLTDVSVKAGDTVTGGVTPMARVRDVYAYIGSSMQLKSYTAEGDNGNHTHYEVNNAKAKNYHGLDDVKKSSKN